MADRPILFSGPMVSALLAGTKTQTRRVVKPQPAGEWAVPGKTACPYGQPDDRLWVRETWMDLQGTGVQLASKSRYAYGADTIAGSWDDECRIAYGLKWKPSIHMPRAACRITLEITGVRVERLQDISADDARAEGCPDKPVPGAEQASVDAFARQWYGDLWEQINGPGSWDANPWVWVVEFRVMKPGEVNQQGATR